MKRIFLLFVLTSLFGSAPVDAAAPYGWCVSQATRTDYGTDEEIKHAYYTGVYWTGQTGGMQVKMETYLASILDVFDYWTVVTECKTYPDEEAAEKTKAQHKTKLKSEGFVLKPDVYL